MAHFARIDNKTNKVLHVHVVDNINAPSEEAGIGYLLNVHKNQPWINDVYFVQTSYNSNIREKYAGIGDEWHSTLNAFISAKPFESFILNTKTKKYEAPKDKPIGINYCWDESKLDWVEISLMITKQEMKK